MTTERDTTEVTTFKVESSKAASAQLATVVKSPVDNRDYRYVVMENGLKALLISNPDTDKSAAAVDVNVGSFQDPDNRLGLAHFLEHMLFMGNEKYPEVDGYFEFIRANGGSANAYTADVRTNYYFDINNEQLRPALDQLAQFFVAPTLDPAYVDRERNAVDSEYRLHAKEDGWRLFMAQSATSNPEHPKSRFTIGDLDTLNNDDGKSLWQDLKAFHDTYYVAPSMGVVVYGRETTDQLEAWLKESFADVPDGGGVKPDTHIGVPPYAADQLGVRINIVPLKETRALSLSFPMESLHPYYHKKPMGFLARIVGYEGEGSLHSLLKEQGLIDSLAAYPNDVPGEYGSFNVRMELTPQGLKQVDEITAIVFDYLALIRKEGIQKWLYDETRQIAELGFRYQEARSPQQTATTLASRMHYLPASDLLNSTYLYDEFDPKLIERLMAEMTPDNVRQTVIAQGLPTSQVEPYFDTQYRIRPLSDELLKRLSKPQVHKGLTIPAPNQFIATDLTLRTSDKADKPTQIISEQGLDVWSMTDSSFQVPRASVRLKISTPKASETTKDLVLLPLYRTLLSRSLNEYGYPAKEAGLNYGLSTSREGLTVALSGYQDKQAYLLEMILKGMDQFSPDQAEFEQERNRLVRNLRNKSFAAPYRQGMDRVSQLLYPNYRSDEDVLAAAEAVSFADLKQYATDFYKAVHISMLIYGNHSRGEAMKLGELVESYVLNGSNRSKRYDQPFNVLKDARLREALDLDHNDALYINYIQFDTTENRERAKYSLLGRLLATPFFNQLRTEQQLGYIVNASARPVERHPGMVFIVQSPVLGPKGIEQRVDEFLTGQVQRLGKLTDAELDEYRQGLIGDLTKRDTNPDERAGRFWQSLDGHEADFNYLLDIADAVKTIKVADIQQAMAELLKQQGQIVITSKGKQKDS
ncbi:insulinase family protein [Endozoicomonas euniceicola]|uniref:Protease 3 n=1 Tax=Endozoicomonas euniceicola TaxID=1234143 RepID=A0ABY6GUW7_9GAMM|nr:insulinase family protein [Endozoicomonas euniceicola]UYM15739.1 insulinase family protein [Endozoicomonas euniceicola]